MAHYEPPHQDLRCYQIQLFSSLVLKELINIVQLSSGEPGLVDRVLALHAGSRGFDSHRGHMSERFF